MGPTRCGKSTVARAMYLSASAPRVVIDPADSSLTVTPGCVTFSDVARATNRAGESWRDAASARFVPRDPDDLEVYDALYRWCFARFPRWVWCDEAATVLPVRATPRAGNRYLVQGAKRQLGHLACATRPREIARNLIAQTQHALVWAMPNPDDVRHLADLMGVGAGQLAGELAQLAEHEFLWCDLRGGRRVACPPI